MIQLEEPNDIRQLIREWISKVGEKKRLPLDQGGTIVQLLNVWLAHMKLKK